MPDPCCDYRDHSGACACPRHARTALHPFGIIAACLCPDGDTGVHYPGCAWMTELGKLDA